MRAKTADKVLGQVLLPRPFDQAFTYEFEAEPALGSWVSVPFGPSTLTGVVWSLGVDDTVDRAKIRAVEGVFAAVPMPAEQRRLIEYVAHESMMTLGEALRLALPPRAALAPTPSVTHAFAVQRPADLRLSTAQQHLLNTLGEKTQEKKSLLASAGVSPAIYAALKKKGAIAESKLVPTLEAPRYDSPRDRATALNPEQQSAAAAIIAAFDETEPKPILLDGVTGSGKTHVYFAAIEAALAQGKQVLWLVPEIALADQLRERFVKHFASPPLLWHTEAGPGPKAAAWRVVASGAPCVVLGARSALHCNFQNLGLVIVDEEHEQALKQTDRGAYHARDMAEHRARMSHAAFVMGTATPSLETERRARIGQVNRLRLTQRHGPAIAPKIELVDLRHHRLEKGRWLARPMIEAVQSALNQGDQAMLFLNRRGYAPLSLCSDCGHRVACHQCSAWLVEHRFTGQLECHLCGTQSPPPSTCPSCESENSLIPCGPGIERLMEEAVRTFPGARIGAFSSDTLRKPAETRAAFAAVKDGTFNLLIGTQVLAKGLDFPNLVMVGVVDGDLGLSNEDLRAGERTFQLLQQVTGRAGRGVKPGRALIQTRASQADLMQALAAHDRAGFYDMELQRRETYAMPPYARLACLTLAHENPEALEEIAHALARKAPTAQGVDLWGPTPARFALVRGWHRKRFVIRVPLGKRPQSYMRAWLAGHKFSSKTRVNIDIDPLSLT